MSHDYVFWCGDFNYRVNVSREDAANLVRAADIETLLSADQLRVRIDLNFTFVHYYVIPRAFWLGGISKIAGLNPSLGKGKRSHTHFFTQHC